MRASKKIWVVFNLLLLTVQIVFAQSPPAISYPTPNIYTINLPIAPLQPVNTGGVVPPNAYGGVSTLAGKGVPGNSNGNGNNASFNAPIGSVADAAGNIYVADSKNYQVRKIKPDGTVSVFAGSGIQGNTDGNGLAASFAILTDITIDKSGNLYVVDGLNLSIRKITPSGDVTTPVTGLNQPYGIALDAAGNMFVSQPFSYVILKITPGGVKTVFAGSGNRGWLDGKGIAASFNQPTFMVVDALGSLIVADGGNSILRKIAPDGTVGTFAGNRLSTGASDGTGTYASFNFPNALSMDALGNIYIVDTGNNLIRRSTPAGDVTTIAGSLAGNIDDVHKKAKFFYPLGVAVDATGNLFIADYGNNNIRKVQITGYAIDKDLPAGLVFDPKTGVISGTPLQVWPRTRYKVTAYNLKGESTAVLNIEVKSVPLPVVLAPVITYTTPNVYAINKVITALKPANTGGNVPATVYGTTTIFAGTGQIGAADGSGNTAQFTIPYGITTDADLNIYITEGVSRLRQIQPDGVVTTIGTDGNPGAPFNVPKFNTPKGVVRDKAGNLFIANYGNHNILKVTPDGIVSVFAGGSPGGGFKDGQGTAATITWPNAIAIDANDNLYVTDYTNRIRKISPSGYVYTIAGDGQEATIDGKYTASSFKKPFGIAVDADGNIFVTELAGNVIRKITPGGDVTTFAGNGQFAVADGTGTAASFAGPSGITVDKSGNLYITQLQPGLIRRITPDQVVTTIAGGGSVGANEGVGTNAYFNSPPGIVTGADGNLYIADATNYIKKVIATGYTIDKQLPAGLTFDVKTGIITGTPTVLWPATDYTVTAYNGGGGSSFIVNIEVKDVVPPVTVLPPQITYTTPNVYKAGVTINPLKPTNTGGDVPTIAYGKVTTIAGTGNSAPANGPVNTAGFNTPRGVAVDADGNVFIADDNNNLVRKITPGGLVSTLAGNGNPNSLDGQGTAAEMNHPSFLITDPSGNLYETEGVFVRKITPDGKVTTFAGDGTAGKTDGPALSANFDYPMGLAMDADGNIYVADVDNNVIRKINAAGIVSTFAGSGQGGADDGLGKAASFYRPVGIAVDAAGNVYVGDSGNALIRKITPAGLVSTYAGVRFNPGMVDGPAKSATFIAPFGLATDALGNVYVADVNGNNIRKIDQSGNVTTIAGGSVFAQFGNSDGIGADASFNSPYGLTVDKLGRLLITDANNQLIRTASIYGYTIDKALPPGLSFDYTTGIISGKPTAASPATDYTVTAYNAGGSSSFTLNIKVNEVTSLITASAVTGNINDCENVPSVAYQQFSVTGSNLSENIKVTPPPGFLVAGTSTAGYSKLLYLILKGDGVTNIKVYVKLDDNAAAGSYAGNVTLSSAGATDVNVPVNGEVHKLPVVNPVSDQPGICSGATLTINFMGTADNYSWTNTDTHIGLAASGTGDLSFKAQNNTSAPIVATILVTPNSTSGVCPGKPVTFKITVIPSTTPIVDIKQANLTCPGQLVIFNATAGNEGGNPTYQWQVNGSNAGTNNAVFSSSTLQVNDAITCAVTNTDNPCNAPALSNTLKVYFKPDDPRPILKMDKAGTVSTCAGADITFAAITTGEGINPTYQWLLNGLPVAGNTGKTFTTNTLVNGDKVTCAVINNDGCTPIISNIAEYADIVVTPLLVSTVTINSSVTMPACAGIPVTFTPTPANYQTTAGPPTYVWYLNGVNAGNNNTFTANQLKDGDQVYCLMTTYGNCVAPQAVQSNLITVTLKQLALPMVSINPNGGISGCAGTELTFTATAVDGGVNPTYKWMVNGVQINNPANTFITSTLATGDKVTCIVINNDGCSPVSSPVSAAADIIADPIQTSTVTINTSTAMPVCAGNAIVFVPTPANYQTSGGTPAYMWYVNGNPVSNKETFSSKTLADGDQVYCLMVTYGKCVAPTPAQSNTIMVSLSPESGCVISPIVIPNAFTPNGDGRNDTWSIPALANYPACTVNVFNRYGTSVFQSVGYTKEWAGVYNKGTLPAGTYYYIIDPKSGQDKLSGYVVIMR